MKQFKNDFALGSPSVISISSIYKDEEMRQALRQSDHIRHETLKRLCAMPSYFCKSLKWKNRYYDYFKKKIEMEIESM